MTNKQQNLKREYKQLYEDLLEIYFRHDPIFINYGDNADEYSPEVGTILPKLKNCNSQSDVLDVIYEEFVRWFGEDAGERIEYEKIASETWRKWQVFKNTKVN